MRAPEVLAAARGDHAVHGDAGKAHLLGKADHALHAFAPLRQHVGREPSKSRRFRVDQMTEDVDLAPVQLARELDTGDETYAGRF